MKKTLTIAIAGRASTAMQAWLRWEQLVNEVALRLRLAITHSSVVRERARPKKFGLHRPLSPSGKGRPIVRYSLVSAPSNFITLIQDANLYARRAADGLYLIVATADRVRPEDFVAEYLKSLEECVGRVEGKAGFVLPPTELAANYAHGMNDVRECAKAKVLFYKPGGFLPK